MKQNAILSIYIFSILVCGRVLALQGDGVVITGVVRDGGAQAAIPFANIALYHALDSSLANGAVSTAEGDFVIGTVAPGSYFLRISAVGYLSEGVLLQITGEGPVSLGAIDLHEGHTELEEVIVVGERSKAKDEVDKTTFFINTKMVDASHTGVDILRFVPGIQVDFMQNISLQGSGDIIILVNGMERDRKFVHRLSAEKIDRIEVMSTPPAKYEGMAGGVINIILREDRQVGFDGHIYLDAPGRFSEVYVFPAANFSYGIGKINFYTSYDGDFRYFNVEESYRRKYHAIEGVREITSTQYVRQKNWSHRFHYGLDYFINDKNQLNLYAYYNPFSREQDGHTDITVLGDEPVKWVRSKEDDDTNRGGFYSLYYKRQMGAIPGHDFAVDASFYRLLADNSTAFRDDNLEDEIVNRIMPEQNSLSVRMDYSLPLHQKLKLSTGLQSKVHALDDRNAAGFFYETQAHALYGSLHYSAQKIDLAPGLRVERSTLRFAGEFQRRFLLFLPNFAANYKLREGENLKLNFRRSVYYPGLYQLNPYVVTEDPYTRRSGNPWLEPVMIAQSSVEYSRPLGDGWLSTRAFYLRRSNVVNEVAALNDENVMEVKTANLGTIGEAGLQITGSFNLGKAVSLQAYLKGFRISTAGSQEAHARQIGDKVKFACEAAVSATASFKHGFTLSGQFMYNSPVTGIQWVRYSDPLYFVALEKSFSGGFKAGINTSAPFKRTFTYRGGEVAAPGFDHRNEGNILLSMVPVGFRFTYRFSTGARRQKISRSKEDLRMDSGKGF